MELHPSESELQARAHARLHQRRDFRLHLLIYALVNSALVVIWAATGGPFWPIFPILGWGLGMMVNAWCVYWRQEISAAEITREAERLREEE